MSSSKNSFAIPVGNLLFIIWSTKYSNIIKEKCEDYENIILENEDLDFKLEHLASQGVKKDNQDFNNLREEIKGLEKNRILTEDEYIESDSETDDNSDD